LQLADSSAMNNLSSPLAAEGAVPETVLDSCMRLPSTAQITDFGILPPTAGYVMPETVSDSSAPPPSTAQITDL
jgi:hypothetical protein